MEKQKKMIIKAKYLKENIKMAKDGMDMEKNLIIMVN